MLRVLSCTMKSIQRSLLTAGLLLTAPLALAISPNDVIRAQKILTVVLDLTAKYQAASVNLEAPKPLTDKSGKYFVPYTEKGELAEWATKAINAQAGAALGGKAGEEAVKHLAAKVPFGGLLSGAAKKKGKELGAVAAVGGAKFIKKTSDFSFNNLDDYAVYLHVTHAGTANYAQALATAMSIYPELEKGYQPALQKAYAAASKKTKVATK
jgi:hypothetical protein